MKPLKSTFTVTCLLMSFLLYGSCSGKKTTHTLAAEKVFVGSTPGDSLIKSMLSIPSEIIVDFIRWELKLNPTHKQPSSFVLNIVYGESQPNTLGFKKDHKHTFEGKFIQTEKEIAHHRARVIRLSSAQFQQEISMIQMDSHLLHFLTPQHQFMVGNGGYSYTLNYKGPRLDQHAALTTYSAFAQDSSLQLLYEGRTPCQDFAAEHEMNVSPECFKLKWRLILNRDSASYQPTTYLIRKVVDNHPQDVEGRWKVINGTTAHPHALIIQLDPEMPAKTISLLVGDDNILYFLRKDLQLYVGNEDFSFTLNKRIGR